MIIPQLPAAIAALVDAAADRWGVPRPIARAVAWVESRGNANAVSPKGAKGVMQLMDATAQALGVTNPFNAQQNIDAGVKYLGQLIAMFGETDGLAAYNWGPGNVKAGKPRPVTLPKYIADVIARAEIELELLGKGTSPASTPLVAARTPHSPPPPPSSSSQRSASATNRKKGDNHGNG